MLREYDASVGMQPITHHGIPMTPATRAPPPQQVSLASPVAASLETGALRCERLAPLGSSGAANEGGCAPDPC
jgi:hypothetical protein